MTTIDARITGDLPERTAPDAASIVPNEGTICVSGFGSVGYPKAVPLALAAADRDLSLTVVSGGSVGPEIDAALVEAGAIDRRIPFQGVGRIREAVNAREVPFVDRHVSRLGDEVRRGEFGPVDVAIIEAVAVGEDWLIPSTSIGATPSFVRAADRLIVEVNECQPLGLASLHDIYEREQPPDREALPLSTPGDRIGTPRVPFDPDQLSAVVRTASPDTTYEFRDPTADDRTIASRLATVLEGELERVETFSDAVNVQFGVGSLGNALMGELSDVPVGERSVAYYGEVIQDGLLDLIDAGVLESASATSLALTESGQERLFSDLDRYAERIVVRQVSISNDPALIDRFGVIAVNSAVEVDLYGHVNSTHVRGSQIVNGIGGSGDFLRNGYLSIAVCPSTAVGGSVSRIVPMATHVDHTEHDVDVIVTEHGVADLRGLAPVERATELIDECADPSFRADLRTYLDHATTEAGHAPHDLSNAFEWTDSRKR